MNSITQNSENIVHSAKPKGVQFPVELELRDYFAAAALQGMLAYSHVNCSTGNWVENASVSVVALHAYQYADAMLAAREKPCTTA